MKNFYPKIMNLILFGSIIVLAFTCYNKSGIEDKSTKKAPVFNKTIEDMYNNKYIRSFIEAE